MRTLLRLGTVLTVFLGVSFVQLPISQAVEVPETLADRQPVGAGPVVPDFPIDYLAVLWDTQGGAPEEHADEEAGEHGAVRFRVDGAWTAWQPLIEDGAQAEGQWGSALVSSGDAEAYQVRGVPADAIAPRAVAINTTDGPLVEVGRRPAGGANAIDKCLSRSEWGADESLRFDATGEAWPTEFYPAQTMTVHHTATKNNDDNPRATVQAIYRYHAVDKGWGDIGYHYLIDELGQVYEGRWSGEESGACGGASGGTDFAHDANQGLVTAGHTGGYNSGNMGAAVLGTFTTAADPAPTSDAVGALEKLLAEFATRHGLDPKAVVNYENPADPSARKTVNMISGHRDWVSTQCPGGNLYAMLPAIRDSVAARMSPADAPPSVTGIAPGDGGTVSGASVDVTATATDDEAVTQVAFAVDSTVLATDVDGADGWSVSWDSTTVVDGRHTLTATATDSAGQSASRTVTVTVDNAPDLLTASGVSPSSGKQNTSVKVTITGTGFVSGITTVDLANGTGTEPLVSAVTVVDGSTITATFRTGKTSGPRQDRVWDVVVTKGSESATVVGGFTVLR